MLDEADDRWASEHLLDVNPLVGEITRATDLLRDMPELGVVYGRDSFRRVVRRLLLRSGWHVYYTYQRDRSRIVVVAIWFATRGSGPPL